jgi:hypothetical protein
MTAYEASDLLNGAVGNLIAGQALFITIVSAYLVVAYTVGKKLTKYQVWFINFTFILLAFLGIQGTSNVLLLAFEYGSLRPEPGGTFQAEMAEIGKWITISVRGLITAGALIFMWQVKHTKRA